MARKKKHEEHENLERWLVSYADFITLLFAFFVVMYSISAVNEGKFRVLSDALVAAFRPVNPTAKPIEFGVKMKSVNIQPPLPLPVPKQPFNVINAQTEQARAEAAARAEAIKTMGSEIEAGLKDLIDKNLISVRRTSQYLEVEINSNVLFPSGSARLSLGAIDPLETIAATLKRFPNVIHVEGFTDNVPISTAAFPSNWELSAARAASVVQLLTRSGVDPERMAAIGFGEYRPKGENDTAEGRQRNRRVVLVVLADISQKRPFELPVEAPDANVLPPVSLPGAGTSGPMP
jgi:chemotaxis protein MotB